MKLLVMGLTGLLLLAPASSLEAAYLSTIATPRYGPADQDSGNAGTAMSFAKWEDSLVLITAGASASFGFLGTSTGAGVSLPGPYNSASIVAGGGASAVATDTLVLTSATLATGSLVDVNVSLAAFGNIGVDSFNIAMLGSSTMSGGITASLSGLGATMVSEGRLDTSCPNLWSPSSQGMPETYAGTCSSEVMEIQPLDMTVALEIGRIYTFTHSLVADALMQGLQQGSMRTSATASLYFNVLGDASLTTESGATYANALDVAEPTSLLLLAAALGGAALRNRRTA